MIRWFGCGLAVAVTAASVLGQTADVISEGIGLPQLPQLNPFGGVAQQQFVPGGIIQTWDGPIPPGFRRNARPIRPVIAHSGPPKLDRHGDPLPVGAVARFGTVRLRHGAEVSALAFTRDAKLLCTVSSSDDSVKLWDTTTGKEVARLETRATLVGLANNGSAVLIEENRCKVWVHTATDVVRHLPEKTLPEGANPTALAVNPNSTSFAVAVNGKVLVIDIQTGKALYELKLPTVPPDNNLRRFALAGQNVQAEQPYQVVKLQYSPDGKWLAGNGQQSGVWLWDLRTGKRVRTYRSEIDFPEYAFSPDVTKLAVTGSRLHLYALDSEEPVEGFKEPENAPAGGLRFSADGKLINVVIRNGTVQPYDAATGEAKAAIEPSDPRLHPPFAIAMDGAMVAGVDMSGGIRLWNSKTGKGPDVDRVPGMFDASFSADGKTVTALDQDNKLRTFDAATGAPGPVIDLALPDDGLPKTWAGASRRIAMFTSSGDELEIQFIDADTKKQISKYTVPASNGVPLIHLAQANRDRAVLFCHPTIQIINPTTGKTVRRIEQPQQEGQVRGGISPDGRVVASTTNRGITVWEVATGNKRLSFDGLQSTFVMAFSTDSRLLAASDLTGVIAICDLRTGALVRKLSTINDYDVPWTMCFSPDGKRLVAGFRDGHVAIWDVTTGEVLAPFAGHDSTINSAAFAPDGKRFVTTAADGTALVWDVPEKPLRTGPIEAPLTGFDEAFKLLDSSDATRAQRGVDYLYQHPTEAVKQIENRVLVPAPIPATKLSQHMIDLESDDFRTRENASKTLEKAGVDAAPLLRTAMEKSTNAEVRKLATELVGKLESSPPKTDDLKALRAVEVLENLHTPEAVALLEKWARGPTGRCATTEATAALARLKTSGK
ncbi:wd-40 repeat protein : Uncultured bacterium genome assembly Metasoil_fosmids_resub OS=uncultured bacterium PE=4 SV=1: WD40: WD40: WD40 [Gemmata massiliana]|uniref:Anaphase-promoting complex subunit 4 WD40 domain-containing protein n=1 Tax=Gemmata massiliana TaxID=1210884 RepID=A0A6P2D2A8_9BACT|nr:PQQ-binding-like beta-propeller repeat protein [Gemmata massiliana]VTR95269.1 wd-40 repeat protein : Uncultured bacterium genome assembly Metasoil_fosmids_resub OS=uncultured bacterium PE=4 SV=1: WD40: WD40: WD40 [Gemmata massiliana]